jgi:5-methyltetrahydropteroyltriglutamate--homocysteine methyltransferase
MPGVHRADTVGSLLRPGYLLDARRAFEEGRIDAAELKRVEDRAVDAAIALQEGVGLESGTSTARSRSSSGSAASG